MKRIIIAMAALLFMSAGLNAQAQKIAFVNTQKVIDTLPQKDSLRVQLQEYAAFYESQLVQLEQEINTKQTEYEKEKATPGVSAMKLELLQGNLQRMIQQYQSTQQGAQSDVQAYEGKLFKPLFEEVKKAVADVAKAKGYTSAIDNSSGLVLFMANNNDDITDAVIKYMLGAKPGTPAPKK